MRLIKKERAKDVLIVIGWAIMVASILLQNLYQRPYVAPLDLTLIFVVSALVGMILVDPALVILGWFGFLLLSFLVMFICLTLPIYLGILWHPAFGALMQSEALVMIFKSLFPSLWPILCLIAGVIGGVIGEMLGLR